MSTVTLTIDGRQATVEQGTTVLEAARGLGISIPTLCHVEGLDPAASCFLCCVQIAGRRQLSPACAMPVEDGMVKIEEVAPPRAEAQAVRTTPIAACIASTGAGTPHHRSKDTAPC